MTDETMVEGIAPTLYLESDQDDVPERLRPLLRKAADYIEAAQAAAAIAQARIEELESTLAEASDRWGLPGHRTPCGNKSCLPCRVDAALNKGK